MKQRKPMNKIILAGGSGFLGTSLARHFSNNQCHVTILTRGKSATKGNIEYVNWDGKTLDTWKQSLEGADVLINLNGKSVDCRYSDKNKSLIYSTRLDATHILGQAIQQCASPPKLWINSSSATFYRHALDKEMDEYNGEPGTGFSVDVCKKWEQVFAESGTPHTRKVIIRTAIVLGRSGGALQTLKALVKSGLGGRQGSGHQYISWIHEDDFVRIVNFICSNEHVSGVLNAAAPNPVPNQLFMSILRRSMGVRVALPIPEWLLKIGAVLIGTETELVLKSRRVISRKLPEAGFKFKFMTIDDALKDLCDTRSPSILSGSRL